MSIATILAVLTLVIGVPLLAYVTWRLRKLWQEFHNPVTRVQGIGGTAVLVHTIIFGLIFLNNDMPSLGLGPPIIDTDTTKIITRASELGVALVVGLGILWLLPFKWFGRSRNGSAT